VSYSFSAKGASKTDAILDAESKFQKVCQDMPVHEKDKDAVLSHMRNMINLCVDPSADEEVVISMNGYLSGQWEGANVTRLTVASANCSVSVNAKTVT
jgi:hypothetical protein